MRVGTHPNKCIEVFFKNGSVIVDTSKPRGEPLAYVVALERQAHGDWKTQSVRKEFMGIEKDQCGMLMSLMFNFDGWWFQIKRPDGKMADLNRGEVLQLITKEEYEQRTGIQKS